MSPYYGNFTFVNCPTKLVRTNYRVVDCLSDSENTTLATTSWNLATNMSSCEIISTFKFPVSRPRLYDDEIRSYVLNSDILLTWDVPNCMECEAAGTRCGILDTSNQVTCFSDPVTGEHNGLQILIIVSLSIALPTIACVTDFSFVLCFVTSAQQSHGQQFTAQEIPTQPDTTTVTGLNESTIESYTKVTLGESRRLPGPGDGTCAICLSEYCPKDMIRVIPECRHCFHATCINEWLRRKSTCPICRNPPVPSSAHENVEQG